MSLSIASFAPNLSAKLQVSRGTFDKPLAAPSNDTAKTEFLKEAQKTPAERMRDAILKQMGLTEEEYEAMTPEAQSSINDAIKEALMRQVEEGASATGNFTDILA